MKKILCLIVTLAIVLSNSSIMASAKSEDDLLISKINGVKQSKAGKSVKKESLESVTAELVDVDLSIDDASAQLKVELKGEEIEYHIDLYQSQLGRNSENKVIGISEDIVNGVELVSFSLEKNADETFLSKSNSMKGNTTLTLAFYDNEMQELHYFQTRIKEIKCDKLSKLDDDMLYYELANYGSQPKHFVKQSYDDLSSIDEEVKFSITSEEIENSEKNSTFTDVSQASQGSKNFDSLIEISSSDGIAISAKSSSLISDIPNSVYQGDSQGWKKDNTEYENEGSSAKRLTGYVVYNMPNTITGNCMNYVSRYEAVANWASSGTITHSFIVTHNVWVEYNAYQDKAYIFDDRGSNARLEHTVETYVEISDSDDDEYFTHYQSSSIVHDSTASKLLSLALSYVPYLDDAQQLVSVFTSGTEIRTGALHPTNKYAKEVKAKQDDLQYSEDHVTIEGRATGPASYSFGYSRTTSVK